MALNNRVKSFILEKFSCLKIFSIFALFHYIGFFYGDSQLWVCVGSFLYHLLTKCFSFLCLFKKNLFHFVPSFPVGGLFMLVFHSVCFHFWYNFFPFNSYMMQIKILLSHLFILIIGDFLWKSLKDPMWS